MHSGFLKYWFNSRSSYAYILIYVLIVLDIFQQVREAIAVSLSVLCSNIRLHAYVNKDYSFEAGKNNMNLNNADSWDKLLQERASELVVAIQNANPSDNMENLAETNTLSGSDSNSPDDVQWMETVINNDFFILLF